LHRTNNAPAARGTKPLSIYFLPVLSFEFEVETINWCHYTRTNQLITLVKFHNLSIKWFYQLSLRTN